MAEATTDRRVRRTRELLLRALEELILERGYESVTVQNILDRADVGRSTFYAHFRDKDDLLISGFERLHEIGIEPADSEASTPAQELAQVSRHMFFHAQEARRLFKAMLGKQSGDFVLRMAQARFSEVYRGVLGKIQPDPSALTVDLDATVQYLASTLLSMLVWWLDTESQYSAEQMYEMFRTLTFPGLAAALGLEPEELAG